MTEPYGVAGCRCWPEDYTDPHNGHAQERWMPNAGCPHHGITLADLDRACPNGNGYLGAHEHIPNDVGDPICTAHIPRPHPAPGLTLITTEERPKTCSSVSRRWRAETMNPIKILRRWLQALRGR